MNSTEAGLLQAIAAEPEDDTHRLVYADWLDDNGQPERGEFIRLHIRWCQRDADSKPDEALKDRLCAAWRTAGLAVDGHVYDRGFPAVAWFKDFEAFADQAAEVLAAHPIRVAYIHAECREATDYSDLPERFSDAAPLLRRLVGLGCSSSGWPEGYLTQVLSLSELANLKVLDCYGAQFGPEIEDAIEAAEQLTNLRVLDLRGCEMEDEDLEAVAHATHLCSLVALRLGPGVEFNRFKSDAIGELTRVRHLSLKQLDLGFTWIGDAGLGHLLGWNGLSGLSELNLSDNGLSESGLLALARSSRLANMRRLDVSGNSMTASAALALAGSPWLAGLRELRLGNVPTADGSLKEAVERLRDRFGDAVFEDLGVPLEPSPVCEADRICLRARWFAAARPDHPEDAIL
jgi:uncharacterized protein (TIGR02996 family)